MNASANFFTQKKLLDSTHLSFIVSKTEIKTKKQYTDAILVANMFRMFVCNLASDGVIIQYPHESNTIIDKKDVIDSFPEQALGMFTKDLKEAYVLTGPGSFTTLRVGALTINTVMMTSWATCQLYALSKIDFYKNLVAAGLLPQFGLIYIGQRKFVRLYDFKNDSYERISYEKITELQQAYFCDRQLEDHGTVYTEHMVQRTIDQENFSLQFHNKKNTLPLATIAREKVSRIEPSYMINPV